MATGRWTTRRFIKFIGGVSGRPTWSRCKQFPHRWQARTDFSAEKKRKVKIISVDCVQITIPCATIGWNITKAEGVEALTPDAGLACGCGCCEEQGAGLLHCRRSDRCSRWSVCLFSRDKEVNWEKMLYLSAWKSVTDKLGECGRETRSERRVEKMRTGDDTREATSWAV